MSFVFKFFLSAAAFSSLLAALSGLAYILQLYADYSKPTALQALYEACRPQSAAVCGGGLNKLQGFLYALASLGILFYGAFAYNAWRLLKVSCFIRGFVLSLFALLAYAAYRTVLASIGDAAVDSKAETVFFHLPLGCAVILLLAAFAYAASSQKPLDTAAQYVDRLYALLRTPEKMPDLAALLLLCLFMLWLFSWLSTASQAISINDKNAAVHYIAERNFGALLALLKNTAILRFIGDSPWLSPLITLVENLVFLALYLYFSRASVYFVALAAAVFTMLKVVFLREMPWFYLLFSLGMLAAYIGTAYFVLKLRLKERITSALKKMFEDIKQRLPEFRIFEFLLLVFPYLMLSTLSLMSLHFLIQEGFAFGYHLLIAGILSYAVLYRRYQEGRYGFDPF